MPQMFPLLWLYLFSSIMIALLIMMTYLHFMKSSFNMEAKFTSIKNDSPWKW